MIEVTTEAARTLNTRHSDDPDYEAAVGRYLATGEMTVQGDISHLADWFAGAHDAIVDRTT